MMTLRNIAALVEKEWRHYFGSPIAYTALFVWVLLFGIFYTFMFTYFLTQSVAGQQAQFGAEPLSLNEFVIAPTLQNMAVVVLFVAPMLTMRLFAEEKRQGTLELLGTSPLTDTQIVLGKFIAAVSLYALMILAGMLNFLLLWAHATTPPEWKPLVTAAVGLLLMGSCFISLGTFISTLTRNQVVAATLSFALFLGIWSLSWLDEPSASASMKLIAYLGVTTHMESFMTGVLDLKDLVFYLTFIGFGLFLAHRSIESQRWRA
jgi:ABC-2 type transport system permease protein